ncbi:hypothetical protein BJ508DRAFT_327464 [Ascobolus immersus RN42]|uniref:BTB domain-containing protein n=1 Tax=Ascobolus immersus RN42 TaxID=1160509 RepID=A0A3N4I4N4_ASCIM|nr:hypothetical protein BJ508DRAFT_327464 [Ascobolus immersus RN42]
MAPEPVYRCPICRRISRSASCCCSERKEPVWVYTEEDHENIEQDKKRSLSAEAYGLVASAALSSTIQVHLTGGTGKDEKETTVYTLHTDSLTAASDYFKGLLRFDGTEAHDGVVELSEPYDDPIAFGYFVQFVYLQRYEISKAHKPVAAYVHATIYKLADRLCSNGLKALAFANLESHCALSAKPSSFPTASVLLHLLEFAYREPYESSPGSDEEAKGPDVSDRGLKRPADDSANEIPPAQEPDAKRLKTKKDGKAEKSTAMMPASTTSKEEADLASKEARSQDALASIGIDTDFSLVTPACTPMCPLKKLVVYHAASRLTDLTKFTMFGRISQELPGLKADLLFAVGEIGWDELYIKTG